MVKLLGPVENFELLKSEVLALVSDKLTEQNQISLQTHTEDTDDWYSGIGTATKFKDTYEIDYKFIQPSLKGSVIEQVINKYGAFRSRIMNLRPRACYSVHADFSYRIHIPIVTNPQAWMVWPIAQEMHQFEEGNVYWTNTQAKHSAFNGSLDNRIHIVMCVSKPWLLGHPTVQET
jgi:hypothetical protein